MMDVFKTSIDPFLFVFGFATFLSKNMMDVFMNMYLFSDDQSKKLDDSVPTLPTGVRP